LIQERHGDDVAVDDTVARANEHTDESVIDVDAIDTRRERRRSRGLIAQEMIRPSRVNAML
jgi:hypothetical protein